MQKEILKALNWRYSVQIFDKTKKISADDLQVILESARLTPSSYGLEAWKFIVVENPAIRLQLQEAGYGQSKIADASHLIVLTRRTDLVENILNEKISRTVKALNIEEESLSNLKQMVANHLNNSPADALSAWAKSQTYIALGVMTATASLLGIDNGPIEGFMPDKVDEILGLKTKNLTATLMLALGYRGEDPNASKPKIRRNFADVIEFVK
ncbi:MAG: NAD(P)H-dependent oxidoreductase [Candidatus Falkowbacteria bacterium]|nr:NAD(P)H-dependent oxidoreductase [Candidatus Falkowbacteria bacterium]